MINVEKYLGPREFNLIDNNCYDFLREVWKDYTGVDLGDCQPRPRTFAQMRRQFDRHAAVALSGLISEIPHPVEPCIVYVERKYRLPHCGILIDGKLLHMDKTGMVKHEPLSAEWLGVARYYK
jgi:hypothetical protein